MVRVWVNARGGEALGSDPSATVPCPAPRPGSRGMTRRVLRGALIGGGIATALILGGCAGQDDPAYFDQASSVAPAKYDTRAEQVTAGTAVCIQHEQQQKSDEQIVESIVYWSKGGVTAAEAKRFVPYALQYCDYLLSPEAKQLASS